MNQNNCLYFSENLPNPIVRSAIMKTVGVRTPLSFFNKVSSNRLTKFSLAQVMDFHPHKFCTVPTYCSVPSSINLTKIFRFSKKSKKFYEFRETFYLTSFDDSCVEQLSNLVVSSIFRKKLISISHWYDVYY